VGKVPARRNDGVAARRELAQCDTVFRLRQETARLRMHFMIAIGLALGADKIERHFCLSNFIDYCWFSERVGAFRS
jgi:hypothetical protein